MPPKKDELMKEGITENTPIKLSLVIAGLSTIIFGVWLIAKAHSQVMYELTESRKGIEQLVVQNKELKGEINARLELYSLKKQVEDVSMLLVRERNRTNQLPELEIQERIRDILNTR